VLLSAGLGVRRRVVVVDGAHSEQRIESAAADAGVRRTRRRRAERASDSIAGNLEVDIARSVPIAALALRAARVCTRIARAEETGSACPASGASTRRASATATSSCATARAALAAVACHRSCMQLRRAPRTRPKRAKRKIAVGVSRVSSFQRLRENTSVPSRVRARVECVLGRSQTK
jgi:hypothetical protein